MIRTALDGVEGVRGISCELAQRRVRVQHQGPPDAIAARLLPLGLGATLLETVDADSSSIEVIDAIRERRTLRVLLAVNATMFVVELWAAWLARSSGLLADSLDMFADAAVYGLALYAVGRSAAAKVRTAHVAGWLQAALAIGALVQVVRRFMAGGEPAAPLMMAVAAVALLANVFCLWLVSKHRAGGAHMRASAIFSANDVLANAGVIIAGGAVALTGSRYPDLAIGAVIALAVLLGARRILRLK